MSHAGLRSKDDDTASGVYGAIAVHSVRAVPAERLHQHILHTARRRNRESDVCEYDADRDDSDSTASAHALPARQAAFVPVATATCPPQPLSAVRPVLPQCEHVHEAQDAHQRTHRLRGLQLYDARLSGGIDFPPRMQGHVLYEHHADFAEWLGYVHIYGSVIGREGVQFQGEAYSRLCEAVASAHLGECHTRFHDANQSVNSLNICQV